MFEDAEIISSYTRAQAIADAGIRRHLAIESGRIDGAGELRIFHTLGLRAMTPALVTVFLFQLVGIWNNFFLPLIMLAAIGGVRCWPGDPRRRSVDVGAHRG